MKLAIEVGKVMKYFSVGLSTFNELYFLFILISIFHLIFYFTKIPKYLFLYEKNCE